ncbi:MAG TPA: hypothetical protein VNT75_26380 [Symbiobacteriaceae bacterium]|nr:hypothetical protein [Symbiobacteriaceae bacterium]
MIEGKADLLEACRNRKMKVAEKPANLLETRLKAEGTLDGMDVRVDVNCITGMPGESTGTVTFKGNLAQIMAVLSRVWPTLPDVRDVSSPGRQSWPERPSSADKKQRNPKLPRE